MGQPERARPILERSVEVYRASLGPDHPAYAASLNVLASFFTSTGEWELAKTLFEESLAIGQRAFGPVHRDVGDSLYNLAYLHRSMGDYQTAGAYYERALETYESVLGPDGRDVGKTLNSHAVMYLMMGDNDRAREKLERAVEIIDDSRLIWYNLACLRALSGNESLALDALEHSVDLGYAEVDHIESDPDLESLRGTERYQNIVRKLNSSNSSE
jgi:tetratricopeptide (TPR) repeat protein